MAKANWHRIFRKLLSEGRTVYLVKLWAEVAGLELREATVEIEAIRNRNRPLPKGTEHPSLAAGRLEYYIRPWHFDVMAQLTRTHHRILAQIKENGIFTIHCQDGPAARGQVEYKAAIELVRNGLASQRNQYNGSEIASGGLMVNYAVLTIAAKDS